MTILNRALLNIRLLGQRGRAHECWVEADHVHNIPELLATADPSKEKYYWEVERKIYLDRLQAAEPGDRAGFEDIWDHMNRLDERPDAYTIYIPVRGASPPTLRATTAIKLDSARYCVLPTEDYDPEKEVWEFQPGTIVECDMESNTWPMVLVAKRRVD